MDRADESAGPARPDDWRRRGVALLAVAVGALLAFGFLFTPPDEMEYAFQDAETSDPPAVAGLAARGPAVARYEPESDTTVMVFQCAHDHCDAAVRVAGRHDAAGPGTFVLDLPGWKRPVRFEPLDPPMAVPSFGPEPTQQVTRVVDATLERQGPGTAAAAHAALLGAAGAGFALALRRPAAAGPVALAAMAGQAPGLVLAAGGAVLLVFAVPAVLVPVGLGGAGLIMAGQRRPRLRAAGWAAVAFLVALLASAVAFAPYYTQPPTM